MGPLRILHLEDNANDTDLLRMMLEEEELPCTIHRVETRKEFEAALERGDWQLIISDFKLPAFDGLKALAMTREKYPTTPFILFSGTIGEEMAIESLKSGATDYVLKERPARLITAVRHALREAEDNERRRAAELELQKSEERKKQLELQFLRVQRMESIGALAGGIAHDLNNALVPVLVGITFLQSQSHDSETDQMLSLMEGSVRRGADMVRHLLTFARGVEGTKTTVKMDSILREMDKILKDIFPKSIQWRLKIADHLWLVSGYATQLHQVLMNLCINARDAMPKGGQLTLAAENVSLDEKTAAGYDAAPGPYLTFTVADTGTGMTQEVQERIFQPFFTTKEPGRGTGLGLSTSRSIVKNHGGFMTVKSEIDRGTAFTVYLPAVVQSAAIEAEKKRAALPTGNGEWILVVDDETAICEITKATLENYGYHVLVASSGPEAVAIFAQRRNDIKLALTDTSMPFMDGRATCLALRKINPHLKIIAASGAERQDDEDTKFRTKIDAYVHKPYTMEKLLNTVHEVLSRQE